jgi:hypothetical protein
VTLKRAEACCVCITATGDEWVDGLHLKTVELAAEAIDQAGAEGAEANLLPEPCFFLICDHCEEEAEDEERGLHFESAEEALKWAKMHRWTTDGRRTWCDDCSGVSGPHERIPVLSGQIPLGAVE